MSQGHLPGTGLGFVLFTSVNPAANVQYADAFQQLHESDLHHQYSSYHFLEYNTEKHVLLQTGIPL